MCCMEGSSKTRKLKEAHQGTPFILGSFCAGCCFEHLLIACKVVGLQRLHTQLPVIPNNLGQVTRETLVHLYN